MPESNDSRRRGAKLGDAEASGQLLRVRCNFCRSQRHYQPADIMKLAGNVPFNSIHGRCMGCYRDDYLDFRLVLPTAAERQAIRVRRLAGVRMVRQVRWRDE